MIGVLAILCVAFSCCAALAWAFIAFVNSSGTPGGGSGTPGGGSGTPGGGSGPTTVGAALPDKFAVTFYTYQDNTPCNSSASSSGRRLIPYVSAAVPFRYLKEKGGPLAYGDHLFVKFLEGRTMPNGRQHTGWVQLDDFCGDGGDDGYCFQDVGGKKVPPLDLYIGDWTKSGMRCDGGSTAGPAGGGQELTEVRRGSGGAKFVADYGGAEKGSGRCGDCGSAKKEQCAWHYTPKYEKWWDDVCK